MATPTPAMATTIRATGQKAANQSAAMMAEMTDQADPRPAISEPTAVTAGPYFCPIDAAVSSSLALMASRRPMNVSADADAWPESTLPSWATLSAAAWV